MDQACRRWELAGRGCAVEDRILNGRVGGAGANHQPPVQSRKDIWGDVPFCVRRAMFLPPAPRTARRQPLAGNVARYRPTRPSRSSK